MEHSDRGEIHPLRVIDGHNDGGGGGHRPKASQDSKGNGPLVGSGTRTRGPQESHLERQALRLRQGWKRLLEDGLEEVTEGRVGETRFRLDRAT